MSTNGSLRKKFSPWQRRLISTPRGRQPSTHASKRRAKYNPSVCITEARNPDKEYLHIQKGMTCQTRTLINTHIQARRKASANGKWGSCRVVRHTYSTVRDCDPARIWRAMRWIQLGWHIDNIVCFFNYAVSDLPM